MSTILFIDTSEKDTTVLAFTDSKGEGETVSIPSTKNRSELLLVGILELVKKHGISLSQIEEIRIATGPGSFTGLKVGATVGVTLSWLLQKSINGLPAGLLPQIHYGDVAWQSAQK